MAQEGEGSSGDSDARQGALHNSSYGTMDGASGVRTS